MKDNRKVDEIIEDGINDINEFFNFIDNMFKDNKKEKKWKIIIITQIIKNLDSQNWTNVIVAFTRKINYF